MEWYTAKIYDKIIMYYDLLNGSETAGENKTIPNICSYIKNKTYMPFILESRHIKQPGINFKKSTGGIYNNIVITISIQILCYAMLTDADVT